MSDLDPRTRDIGQLHFSRFGIEARQFLFNRLQCFEHLDRQKQLGPLLCLGNCQHSAIPSVR
jgi:hypothetical protein